MPLLIETTVEAHIERWAATIARLRMKDPQFRNDIAAALRSCLLELHGAPTRIHRRPNDLGRDFQAVADQAAVAAEQLRILKDTLDRLPVMWRDDGPDSIDGLFDVSRMVRCPLTTAEELEKLAAVARRKSKRFRAVDPGGNLQKTEKLRAFTALAKGLVRAYQRATGRSGIGYGAREGELRRFVEAVLPTARDIAKTSTGSPFEHDRNGNTAGCGGSKGSDCGDGWGC
jgi:hypothetical protein